MANMLGLLVASLLIAAGVNCDSSGIVHSEVQSAFVPWFNAAILNGSQVYQLTEGATFTSTSSKLASSNISVHNVTFTVGPISRVQVYVENEYNGVAVRLDRPSPLDITFQATAVNVTDLAEFDIIGELHSGQRVSFNLHRARESNATLDLASVKLEKKAKKGDITAVSKDVKKVLEDSKQFWAALDLAVTQYYVDLWDITDHSAILEGLHELYKFYGIDIYNYE
ncbi:hypothetical protein HDE_04196 [Halotydeus destructor]|nr:hypothetical protein HDE_04196 [Halotydeus destructor]